MSEKLKDSPLSDKDISTQLKHDWSNMATYQKIPRLRDLYEQSQNMAKLSEVEKIIEYGQSNYILYDFLLKLVRRNDSIESILKELETEVSKKIEQANKEIKRWKIVISNMQNKTNDTINTELSPRIPLSWKDLAAGERDDD